MASFSRIEVAQLMSSTGVVPLFYNPDIEVCKKIVSACYRGGARTIEFTNRGDFAFEVFALLSKYVKASLPEMALGIGSTTDAAAASQYMLLGADFIVTPTLREDIAIVCNRRKVLWSPGCATLGEISRAEELGCEIIKLFPGGVYGPGFVSAIKAPCPWTSIMPTGGVAPTEENLTGWFGAGVTCVGMGSKLITKAFLENNDFEGLEQKMKDTLALVKSIREA